MAGLEWGVQSISGMSHHRRQKQFRLYSKSFSSGGAIPQRFTALGAGINPELNWNYAPLETKELALICEDPDAPTPKPFVHWLLYGISPTVSAIPEGITAIEEIQFPVVARQGKNSKQEAGYTGPNPPVWDHWHRYYFRLFALSEPIEIVDGAGREEFFKAIAGKVIGEASLLGLYEKPKAKRVQSVLTYALPIAAIGFGAYMLAKKSRGPSSPRIMY
jgi:Raf kinase inhibitor-like YbhB/YbcL family protein